MDIIKKQANKFAEEYFMYGVPNDEILINGVKRKISYIDSQLDKIIFLNVVLETNNLEYDKHKLGCKDIDCDKNLSYENITYYLNQELTRLGVQINSDAFTSTEKQQADSRLDEILSELSSLKAGQQVIYEDLQREINELRTLFFLGKKNWYQLLIGKATEMVAAGIISETISRQIVESLKHLPALLTN